jgi:hypothetical protein
MTSHRAGRVTGWRRFTGARRCVRGSRHWRVRQPALLRSAAAGIAAFAAGRGAVLLRIEHGWGDALGLVSTAGCESRRHLAQIA